MRRVYLHIGHGKTGSTYLQNALAKSVNLLAARGISYPMPDRLRRDILGNDARINSGNFESFQADIAAPAERLAGKGHRLYSYEGFLYQLADPGRLTRTTEVLAAHFDIIEALLFVRDPIDFGIANWMQRVKRHGWTGPLDEALLDSGYLTMLASALALLSGEGRIRLTVHNYSRVSRHVVDCAERWLSLEPGTLALPSVKKVNRSLTAGELKAQLLLNRLFGKRAATFSKKLCQNFPNRHVPPLTVSDELRASYRIAYGGILTQANSLLPPEAELRL